MRTDYDRRFYNVSRNFKYKHLIQEGEDEEDMEEEQEVEGGEEEEEEGDGDDADNAPRQVNKFIP